MHVSAQQARVQRYITTNDACGFSNLLGLHSSVLLTSSTQTNDRIRIFPATETLSMFMSQALKVDRSCQGIVNDVAIKHQLNGLPPLSTNTSAYCQARLRLPVDMVSGLVRKTGKLISEKSAQEWLWFGRRVRLVDGTTVTLPDTKANQEKYPQQTAQKVGLGFPKKQKMLLL